VHTKHTNSSTPTQLPAARYDSPYTSPTPDPTPSHSSTTQALLPPAQLQSQAALKYDPVSSPPHSNSHTAPPRPSTPATKPCQHPTAPAAAATGMRRRRERPPALRSRCMISLRHGRPALWLPVAGYTVGRLFW